MSSSAIFFKGYYREIKDSALGWFIDKLEEEILSNYSTSEYKWLNDACRMWQEDWDKMPPGCKDIELDHVLIDISRQETLRLIAEHILEIAKLTSQNPEFLTREITVLKEILEAT